jgi:hypothetical protein
MTTDTSQIILTITEMEVANSGIDPRTYIFGIARRNARNGGKDVSMVEYRLDEAEKKYRVIIYLKAKNAR